ncbi:MAG TPA: sigma 54-interacting transcriptional regulator [Acidobacteriota bacterium]|nr:sigma 54-interacting transcriptional regulator [Acidobacteriota bacterium]
MPISQQIDSLTLIGKSDVMQQLYKMIGRVCNVDCAVLLIGEKGSGRGVVARALHYFSHRAASPFNIISAEDARETNDEELLGIDLSHPTESTYYITDYTAMRHLLQQQLLNIHQRKEFKCAHSNRFRKHNYRFLVAARESVDEDLQNAKFPADLFYDWNFLPIYIAPLRDRREDIPLHANQFLELLASEMKVSRKELTPEALEILQAYEWPRNMNELKEALRTALMNCRGNYIRPEHLPELRYTEKADTQTIARLKTFLDSKLSTYVQNSPTALSGNLFRLLLPQIEKSVFDYALRKCNGNRNKAAQLLGLHRNTLNKKLQQHLD